jgi:hypothetical protein
MDPSIPRSLLRHGLVTIPLLLVTLAATLYLNAQATDTYRSSGTLTLASPAADPSREPERVIDANRAAARLELWAQQQGFGPDGSTTVTVEAIDASTLGIVGRSTRARAANASLSSSLAHVEDDLDAAQAESGITQADRLEWLLLTPSTDAKPTGDGTFEASATLWLGGLVSAIDNPVRADATTARVMITSLNGGERGTQLQATLPSDTTYVLRVRSERSITLVDLATTASNESDAVEAFQQVVDQASAELEERQARATVPPNRRIFLDVVAAPIAADAQGSAVSGRAFVALCIGIAFTVAVSGLIDLRDWRRQRSLAGASGHMRFPSRTGRSTGETPTDDGPGTYRPTIRSGTGR